MGICKDCVADCIIDLFLQEQDRSDDLNQEVL